MARGVVMGPWDWFMAVAIALVVVGVLGLERLLVWRDRRREARRDG